MDKKLAGLLLAPKISEFSNEPELSQKQQPIVLKIYGKEVDFEIDLDNNVYLKNINFLIQRGKEIIQEFDKSDEIYKEDKSVKCLKFLMEALETISLTTKELIISNEVLKISASESMRLLSKDIELGSLENLEGLDHVNNPENLNYDFLVTINKLKKWWSNTLKPVFSKLTELDNKYNSHIHLLDIPHGKTIPGVEVTGYNITGFENVNSKASTAEKLIPSKTTKAI
jgi:hypothetical protein